MRIALALSILCWLVVSSASRTMPAHAAGQDTAAIQSTGGTMGTTEIDLVKWGFTQGGLTLLLLVVLMSYRRDFFRKNEAALTMVEALREEKRDQVAVLDKCAHAMLTQAVATQANTKATELLAQNVNNLAERRNWNRE